MIDSKINVVENSTKECILPLVNKNENNSAKYFINNESKVQEILATDDLQVSKFSHQQYIWALKDAIRVGEIDGDCVYTRSGKLFCIKINNNHKRVEKCYIVSEDAKSVLSISDYNPRTGKMLKTILYREEEKTISSIKEYDFETGKDIRCTFYHKDGKTVSSLIEYSNRIKYTLFHEDGKNSVIYV